MTDLAAVVDRILVRHSRRGMERLQPYRPGAAVAAARAVADCRRGTAAVVTGFWVAGAAETDGPLGALALGAGLARLGFRPVIVSDHPCCRVLPDEVESVEVVVNADPVASWTHFKLRWNPTLLIAIERCARTADGDYANMRGVSIAAHTAPLDWWFELARPAIPTVGIGDGGNEVGMGCLAAEIAVDLGLEPAVVATDHLILATVSNWGAYGLLAGLQAVTGVTVLPTGDQVESWLDGLVARGAVDGFSGRSEATVDGHPVAMDRAVLDDLERALA